MNVNHVIYEHEDPAVGNNTQSHGTSIRGNINIYYSVTIDHGSLVGDGNVHPDHIDSGSAFGDYPLFADGSGASGFRAIGMTDVEVLGNSWNHILDGLGSTHNIGEALDILDDLRFVELEDTPTTITADECVKGNSAGDLLVFGACGTGGGGGGGSGSGYGDWEDVGRVTGAISGNPVTITLDSGEDIDDYEELYIHIEANDTNDQRVVSTRFRASEVPVTTLAGGGLGLPFAGNATDEGAVLVRRNTDGTVLTLDVYGSVINFPATSVTTIHARELTAGGGGAGTELTQAQVEDETDTTFGQVSGERLAQAVAVFAPGSSSSADRTVLADAVAVSNTAGPHEIALTEAMTARQLVTFFAFSSATASPDGIGYLLSDDILALLPEATAPTDAENALPIVIANYAATSFSQQSGNYFVYRKDDSTLWVRQTRLAAHTLTITATPIGGGTTGGQQSGGRELVDRTLISAGQDLTRFATSVDLEDMTVNSFPFTEIPIEDIDRFDLGIELDGTFSFVVNIGIPRRMVIETPTTPANLFPSGGTTSRSLESLYWSGRTSASQVAEIGVPVSSPQYSWVNSRRANGVESVNVTFTKNTDGDVAQIHIWASSDVDMRLVYAIVRRYE